MTKKPKQAETPAYAIVNPFGDFWSPLTFATSADAKAHLTRFWLPSNPPSGFTFPAVDVRLTLRPTPTKSDDHADR